MTSTGISGLWMVESVDSIKLASQLNKLWELEDREEKLNVMLQINTSHEKGNAIDRVLSFIICQQVNQVVRQRRAWILLSTL